MIKIEGKNVSFEVEASDNCEFCGKKDELRPYGPNNERICHPCGQKDPETTSRMMGLAFEKALASKGLNYSEANLIDPDEPNVIVLDIALN